MHDVLRAYALVHATYQLLRFTSPPQPAAFIALQAPFVLAALIAPSRVTLTGSAIANVITTMMHLPAVVDMDHWAMHTDIAVTLICVGFRRDLPDTAVALLSAIIRIQMAIFYSAAGIWKLTTDHCDPRLSCSSLLLAQILCGWLPIAPPVSLLSVVVHSAPHITLLIEISIPIFLLSSSRQLRRAAILLAILLHTGIMVAPLPLSIADFSAMCSSRLFWIIPHASARAIAEVQAGIHTPSAPSLSAAALVVTIAAVVCGVHGSYERVLANLTFTALAAVMCRAVFIDATSPAYPPTTTAATRQPLPLRSAFLIVAAFSYAFLMPMLGLIDVGGCTMFSHIKMHGGSNHAFLPTGIVQRWLAPYSFTEASRTFGLFADFTGGVVRIERSTSTFLNEMYPGEVVTIHPEPLVREHLREIGHVARLFTHPGARARNLRGKSLEVGGGLTTLGLGLVFEQAANGAQDKEFVRYSLPALELRMMLEAIRERSEAFEIEYTTIAGGPPSEHALAEAWRADGCGVRVTLKEDPARRARTCTATDTCRGSSWRRHRACDADTIAMLDTPPRWLARTLLLSNPYPLLKPAGRYCGSSG